MNRRKFLRNALASMAVVAGAAFAWKPLALPCAEEETVLQWGGFKNYSATYEPITKQDLLYKMRALLKKTVFQPPVRREIVRINFDTGELTVR